MTLSVVIPTCNRPDHLSKCLHALAPGAQTLPENQYEVIVSDDGNPDSTESLIKTDFPWARWVRGPKRGPAANRNYGSKQASFKWLVFTDDDCLPEPGWLQAFIDASTLAPGTSVFEGPTLPIGNRTHPFESAPINEKGGFLWSCNFMISSQLFRQLNGFDERFTYAAMEDNDLHYRILQNGYLPHFVDNAIVLHPWKKVKLLKHRLNQLKAESLYLRLHPEEKVRLNWRRHAISACRYWLGPDIKLYGKYLHLVFPKFVDQSLAILWHLLKIPSNSSHLCGEHAFSRRQPKIPSSHGSLDKPQKG